MSNDIRMMEINFKEYCAKNDFNYSKTNERSVAFENMSAELFFKSKNLNYDQIKSGIVGGGNDLGIDGFFFFIDDFCIENEETLDFVCKPLEKKNSKDKQVNIDIYILQQKSSNEMSEGVVDKFLSTTYEIFDLGTDFKIINEKTALLEKVINFKKAYRDYLFNIDCTINVHYCYIFLGDSSNLEFLPTYKNKISSLVSKVEEILGSCKGIVSYQIIGASELQKYKREKNFKDLELIIEKKIDATYENKDGFVVLVTLTQYKNMIVDSNNKIRAYLFESNIRDFQNRTDVNKEIENSLKDKSKKDFWWLNNGITIIADKVTPRAEKLTLRNPQIVNGLQTSYSIANIDILNDDKRMLLVKVLETDEEYVQNEIIRSTNSQNKVPIESFKANEKVQLDLDEYLYENNWNYERRKNNYQNSG